MKEFYPAVKKALEYSFTQRPDLGPSQIIAMPPQRAHAWNDSDGSRTAPCTAMSRIRADCAWRARRC